jgi:hypothetical protein
VSRSFDLQRSVGNRAVASILGGGSVQRVKAGWDDADTSGKAWNKKDRDVDGTRIRRVPVQGITLGNQKDNADYGDEALMTDESAKGRAIVLYSTALDKDKPVDVLLHFHGWDFRKKTDPHAGWRQNKSDGTVRDIDQDQIEQQMEAVGTTQTIGVLPQGIGKSRFGDMPWNDYIREVLGIVATMGFAQIPKVPDDFRLILSGHSGGGGQVTKALDVDTKHHTFPHEPSNLVEVVLFEALHGEASEVASWAEAHMKLVRDAPAADRAAVLAACPRLRAYYSANGDYVKQYELLDQRLQAWLDANERRLGPALHQALADRFQVHKLEGANHETVVRGLGDKPSEGAMADALRAVDHPEAAGLLEKGTPSWVKPKWKDPAPAGKATPGSTPKTTPTTTPAGAGHEARPSGTRHRRAGHGTSTVRDIPTGAIRGDRLGRAADEIGGTEFRRLVYEKQLRLSVDRGKEFFPGLDPKTEIGHVDGFEIRKDVAQDAQALMDAARAALAAAKAKDNPVDEVARGCKSIGIQSAYRSLEHDFSAWQDAYKDAFTATAHKRDRAAGGPLSDAASGVVAHYMLNSKAIPGFSNHTRGLAIDFKTTQDGHKLGPQHAQDDLWTDAWFRKWLEANSGTYHFRIFDQELWHFDHDGAPAAGSPDTAHPDHATSSGGSAGSGGSDSSDDSTAKKAEPVKKVEPVTKTEPATTTSATTSKRKKKRKKARKASSAAPPPTTTADADATHDKKRRAPLAADAPVTLTWGEHARRDVVADSSLEIIRDIMRTAGLDHATITSTARTAEDQARAMYQNLVGKAKNQGVTATRHLYHRSKSAQLVIDTFVELRTQGLSAKDIQAGMKAKLEEVGPSTVSNHCADPKKLNVIDIGPASLGDTDDQDAFEAAANAEVGKHLKRFINRHRDPGEHLEIPPH